MNTRLLAAAGIAAICLSSAPAPAASLTNEGTSPSWVLLALCPDGSERLAVSAPTMIADGSIAGSFLFLDAAQSLLDGGCDGFVLALPPGGGPESDPGRITTQDAAVWSRGTPPVVRASGTP